MKLGYFVLLLILISCSNGVGSRSGTSKSVEEGSSSSINTDSLVLLAKEDSKISEIEIKRDTFLMVSTNKFLYYPFGIYKNFDELLTSKFIKESYEIAIDSSMDTKVLEIKKERSIVKFLESEDTRKVEIFSSTILEDFPFVNGIKIGMKKEEFLGLFLKKVPKQFLKFSVFELDSGVTGIWHYYTFHENKLVLIVLKTDYYL